MTTTLSSVNECKLINNRFWESTSLGHPLPSNRIKSTGVLNVAMLFVDYMDVPALGLTDSALDLYHFYANVNENLFQSISYGRLKLQITPHLHWLRLSKLSIEYGDVSSSFEEHRNFIRYR